jgi:hypothetical protein
MARQKEIWLLVDLLFSLFNHKHTTALPLNEKKKRDLAPASPERASEERESVCVCAVAV